MNPYDLVHKQVTWRDGSITRHGTVIAIWRRKCRVRPMGHTTRHEFIELRPQDLTVKAFHELNERVAAKQREKAPAFRG